MKSLNQIRNLLRNLFKTKYFIEKYKYLDFDGEAVYYITKYTPINVYYWRVDINTKDGINEVNTYYNVFPTIKKTFKYLEKITHKNKLQPIHIDYTKLKGISITDNSRWIKANTIPFEYFYIKHKLECGKNFINRWEISLDNEFKDFMNKYSEYLI